MKKRERDRDREKERERESFILNKFYFYFILYLLFGKVKSDIELCIEHGFKLYHFRDFYNLKINNFSATIMLL